MTGTIGDICFESGIASDRLDDGICDCFDVGFDAAPDIISFTDFSFLENQINGAAVIGCMQPLSFVAAALVEGERFFLEGTDREVRNYFFRELVRSVVIRAVADGYGEAEGVIVRTDGHIGAGLRCVIGSAGKVGTFFGKGFCRIERQISIDFASGDVMKPRNTAFIRRFQEDLGPEDIRAEKESRIHDSAGVMGLGREIHDNIRFFFLKCCTHGL